MTKFKFIPLLPLLLLQGCLWQSVGSETLYYAKKICAENGMKIYRIDEWWTGKADLVCSSDGLRTDIKTIENFDIYIFRERRKLLDKPLLEENQHDK